MAAETPSPRRRWLSFSLRGVLLLLTALCIWLAIIATRARNQARSVAAVAARGGQLRFDYEPADRKASDRPRPPQWLRQAVGEEYFRQVQSVTYNVNGGIGGLQVTDDELAVFDALPDLTTLELSNNPGITDAGLKHLAAMAELRTLYLYNTSVAGPGIKLLPRRLEYLELSYTPLEDEGLAHLRGMRRLKYLRLNNTAISDHGLADLSEMLSLEELRLSHTDITDAGLEHLKPLQNLKELSLPFTNVTSRGIVQLQKALPNCQVYPPPEKLDAQPVDIELWPAGYQPTKMEFMAKVKELGGQATIDGSDPDQPIVALTLHDSLISDESLLTLLEQMPKLQRLNLRDVLAGDALAKELPRWQEIHYLSLGGSRITDAALSDLAKLAALRELDLSETGISDAGLAHLSGLKNLTCVHANHTRVTHRGRAQLRQVVPNCWVQ